VLSGILAFLLAEQGWLAGIDAGGYDLAVSSRPPLSRPARVAVVLIDDASLQHFGRWPWPWSQHARLVETLNERYHPAAIAFDILFAEPDPRDSNHEFARAVRRAGNVYLAAYLTQAAEAGGEAGEVPWLRAEYLNPARYEGKHFLALRPPVPELAAAAAGVGPVNVVPELDGCIRRVPMIVEHQGRPYPSLAAVTANAVVNRAHRPVRVEPGGALDLGGYRVPIDTAGEILVSYHAASDEGAPYGILHTRYEDILSGSLPPEELRDKVVLVGFGAAGLGDVHPTPLAPGTFGADINAQAINGILQGSFIRVAGWPARLGMALVLGMLAGLIAGLWSPGKAIVMTALMAAGEAGGVILLLWTRGLWVGVAAPALAALCGYSLTLVQRYRESECESIRVQAGVETLARATRIIGSVRQRSELLGEIREQITEVMGARQTNLYLMDPDRQRLVLARESGNPEQAEAASYAVGEGTVGWVAQHRFHHAVQRLEQGSHVAEELARSVRFPVGSAVYAPLQVRGEVIGAVEVVRGVGEPPFQDGHLAVLTALASEVAVALDNMKLCEQLSGRVEIANRQLVAAYSELRQERDRVAAIVSNMADGVLLTDAGGRILFINPAAAQMFGLDPRGAEGRPAREVLPYPALMAQLGDAPTESQTALPTIRVEEPRHLVLSPRTVRLLDERGQRTGAITVVSDVTLLQELSEMKTEFVSVVSHELRTPLTSIMGFAETLMVSGDRPAAERDEFLGIIQQESNRLLVMINDLLDVSRMEAGRPLALTYSLVDLREVIAHVVRFQQVVTSRHQFHLALPDSGLQVEADRDKVVQILTNLISNAIKYSPKGGEIRIGGADRGDEVVVDISDQGVGMSSEELGRLFQRYQRVDRDAIKGIRGTGLGLYLVRGLVEAHGGRIWAESSPGEGSVFHFTLAKRRAA